MEELFKKRRRLFGEQIGKYLPYVFNDHFVLVLLFLLGFLMVQYRELLLHFPSRPLLLQVSLAFILVILLHLGSIATYLESADNYFLLTKEAIIVRWIKQATVRAFIVWGSFQSLCLAFLAPIFFKLGFQLLTFMALLLFLLLVKWLLLKQKEQFFFQNHHLVWEKAIQYEVKRKQAILKFFSLFTNVKGISTTVKRRQYLDGLLKYVPKRHNTLWSNLYLRAFLRSSDYLALTLRLLGLSFLSLAFMSNRFIAVGLALTFNYLLLFQLLALSHHFDYHYLLELYPTEAKGKAFNLKQFLRTLAYAVTVLELVVTFSFKGAILLLIVMVLIVEGYLPRKIKQVID